MRQNALAAQATQVSRVYEVEAGIGVIHDLESRKTALLVELGVPLFPGSIVASEARELLAERKLLSVEADLETSRAKNLFNLMSTEVRRLRENQQLAKNKVEHVTQLYRDARKSFNRGQAEMGEVIETLAELYEAKVRYAETTQEVEKQVVELHFFLKGEKP